MIEELQHKAPVLVAILEAASKTSVKNKQNKALICMAGAILLKSRCKHMCKLQLVISSLLYAGHASKRVNSNYHSYISIN